MNAKNTKKSPIHENADANITCDFGDGDISHSRSRLPHTHTWTATSLARLYIYIYIYMKSSGAKRVMRQNKKIQFSLVFACNVLALYYFKIFFRKTSYKAGCGRFAISVLLQNGISDSDLFPQNGLYPIGQSPPSLFSRCGSRLT